MNGDDWLKASSKTAAAAVARYSSAVCSITSYLSRCAQSVPQRQQAAQQKTKDMLDGGGGGGNVGGAS